MKPPCVFEHEWKVEARKELPSGEGGIIHWELRPDGNGTMLHLEHRKLDCETALGFAPGTHALMDRLEAELKDQPLPNWQERYQQVSPQYPMSLASKKS